MFYGVFLEITEQIFSVHEFRGFLKPVYIPFGKSLQAEQILLTISSRNLHYVIFSPSVSSVFGLDSEYILKVSFAGITDSFLHITIIHECRASSDIIRMNDIPYTPVHLPVLQSYLPFVIWIDKSVGTKDRFKSAFLNIEEQHLLKEQAEFPELIVKFLFICRMRKQP